MNTFRNFNRSALILFALTCGPNAFCCFIINTLYVATQTKGIYLSLPPFLCHNSWYPCSRSCYLFPRILALTWPEQETSQAYCTPRHSSCGTAPKAVALISFMYDLHNFCHGQGKILAKHLNITKFGSVLLRLWSKWLPQFRECLRLLFPIPPCLSLGWNWKQEQCLILQFKGPRYFITSPKSTWRWMQKWGEETEMRKSEPSFFMRGLLWNIISIWYIDMICAVPAFLSEWATVVLPLL